MFLYKNKFKKSPESNPKFYNYLNLKKLKSLLTYYEKTKNVKFSKSEYYNDLSALSRVILAFSFLIMCFFYLRNEPLLPMGMVSAVLLFLVSRMATKKGIKEFFDNEVVCGNSDLLLAYINQKNSKK